MTTGRGAKISQYPSAEARDAGSEAGAGRGAAELLADVRDSAAAFSAEAATVTWQAWQAAVHATRGPGHPAWSELRSGQAAGQRRVRGTYDQ